MPRNPFIENVMNKIFKVIYNRARRLYVVVSEKQLSRASLSVALSLSMMANTATYAADFNYSGTRWYGLGLWSASETDYSSVNIDIGRNTTGEAYGAIIADTVLNVTGTQTPSVIRVNRTPVDNTSVVGLNLWDNSNQGASVHFAGDLSVYTTGTTTDEYGIYGILLGSDAKNILQVDGLTQVNVSGNQAGASYGIQIWGGSEGKFNTSDITVSGTGTDGVGLDIQDSSASFTENLSTDVSGSQKNIGISLNTGQIGLSDATLTVSGGTHAWGLLEDWNSTANAGNLNISVSDASSQGVGIHLYRQSTLDAKTLQIDVTNAESPAGIAVTDGSTLTANSAIITVTAPDASTQSADGIAVSERNSSVTLENAQINVSGGTGQNHGFRVSSDAQLTLSDTAIVNAKTAALSDGGTLTIQKNFHAAQIDESQLSAHSGGKILINEAGQGTVRFKGYTTLGDNSSGTQILMNLSGTTSYWDVTQDSQLTDLSISDGTLNMKHTAGFQTVTTRNFGGQNGLFNADVDFMTGKTDKLIITDDASGQHSIYVASSGTATVNETEYLVSDASGKADFSLTAPGGKVDAGNYLYELQTRDNNGNKEWYLTRSTMSDGTPELSPTAEAVVAMAATGAQNALYQNNLSDLRKRLGEVRNGQRDGLWATVSGWKDVLSGYAGSRFRQEAYALSFGLDRAVSDNWLVGANFRAYIADQRTHGHHDTSASGDADSQGINLYATWTHQNGTYADFVLSADRYGQDIDTHMGDGRKVSGSYNTFGYGLSAEIGRKFAQLGTDKTWFIEPQAQLSWYHVKGDDFTMSNGMQVRQDDADSLTARLGLVAGRDIPLEGGRKGQYYLKAGINHELDGDQSVTLNNERFSEHDIMGTRYYYGAGLDWELDKTTRLYGQIEREEGSHYTKEIEIRAGIKHSF